MSLSGKVSLITPCFNAGPYLKEYLLSVAAQTYRPLELIFVNDGSTDDSAAVYQEVVPILSENGVSAKYIRIDHAGQAAAMNAGLEEADGEFLAWADADDILRPENVEKKVHFLQSHPECGMVRNDACRLENGALTERISKEEDRKTQFLFEKLFTETTYVYAGCYMLRRSLFHECYPEMGIPYSREGQNLQMLLPPASRMECGFVDEVLMIYRIHADSHAFRKRSFSECIDRINGFEKLYKDLKPYCRYDGDAYDRMTGMQVKMLKGMLAAGLADAFRNSKTEKEKKQ